MKEIIALKDAFKLINPCPTVIVSSGPADRPQLCAAAWCMPLDFNPPKALIVLAEGQATTAAVRSTGDLVLNVPGAEIAERVLAVGRSSGHDRDKWKDFGLNPRSSQVVRSPGVEECLASLECRVLEADSDLGRGLRDRYDIYILEIVHAIAESSAFRERWLLEDGVRLLHHLGAEGFEISGGLLTPEKIF